MRTRQLTAALLAVACVLGLAACRSNVGVAARVGDHTISESDVAKYLTPDQQPLNVGTDNSGQPVTVSQRVLVLDSLIKLDIFKDALAKTPYGRPTDAQLQSARESFLVANELDLAGVETQLVQQGLEPAFARSFVDIFTIERTLEQVVSTEQKTNADLGPIVADLGRTVRVNPRYGTWTANGLVTAPLPDFLNRQPDYVGPSSVPTATSN